MNIVKKYSVAVFVSVFLLNLVAPTAVLAAATTVSLGSADNFAVLADTAISDSNPSVITGDVGLSSVPGTNITALTTAEVTGTIYAMDASGPAGVAGNNPALVTAAHTFLTATSIPTAAAQTPQIAITGDLSTFMGGTLSPGVYNSGSSIALANSGTVTLDGGGDSNAVFVFQAGSTLTTGTASHINLINGAKACNVFWQVGSSATLGTTSDFKGTILAGLSITDNGGSTVSGRLLASGGAVTLNNTNVAVSQCGTIAVTKVVVNDSGTGTKVPADFPLFINGSLVTSGATNTFTVTGSPYTVSETADANYTSTFSPSCIGGTVAVTSGAVVLCTITNDDIAPAVPPSNGSSGGGGGFIIPPLIDVVKVPSPLSLPNGPGPVTYTYTVTNPGTVADTNVTVVDDSCGPLTMVSGDTDADTQLDVSETWTFTCATTLQASTTNTVVATAFANGVSVTDLALATVIVGAPVTPPLIHVTKVPSPLALSAGGGMVTYTERISNPGVVALTNVRLTDDRCAPVTFITGDTDGDAMLDTSETWTYTCSRNLSQTTTNTATAIGEANGVTVTDFAIATVIVGVPGLPNTGYPPDHSRVPWAIIILGTLVVVTTTAGVAIRRQAV